MGYIIRSQPIIRRRLWNGRRDVHAGESLVETEDKSARLLRAVAKELADRLLPELVSVDARERAALASLVLEHIAADVDVLAAVAEEWVPEFREALSRPCRDCRPSASPTSRLSRRRGASSRTSRSSAGRGGSARSRQLRQGARGCPGASRGGPSLPVMPGRGDPRRCRHSARGFTARRARIIGG